METINNVHCQFASFFHSETLKPLAYIVSKKLSEGHICVRLNELEPELADDPFYPGFQLKEKEILKDPFVSTEPSNVQPFMLYHDKLYLQRYFQYETIILDRIQKLIESELNKVSERRDRLVEHQHDVRQILYNGKSKLTGRMPWQTAAAISGALNNFTIITGGPGTGKTTTVAKMLAVLFSMNPSLKVALAAPTGKAAARMAESLKASSANGFNSELFSRLQPSTIHRLLRNVPGTTRFRYNAENPLHYDVVIIDESSMIDVALFAKLLEAIGNKTRLIMLGDKDQLASVEAGSLFGDLCQLQESINSLSNERISFINSFVPEDEKKLPGIVGGNPGTILSQHIIELKDSHRFSDEKGIGRFSKAVINNDVPILQQFINGNLDEQVIFDLDGSFSLFEEFISGYKDYIHEKNISAALRKLNKLRVLCAVREGDQGLYTLNRHIEEFLRRKGLLKQAGEFYEHRPIMITRNNYRLGLYNGDTGILRYDEHGVLRAWFENTEGKIVPVLPVYLTQIETVFAMTIHKSQGSEFDSVMVVLPASNSSGLLTRELLYTAVTRAKEKVVIRATPEIILDAALQQVDRGSGISDRLKELHQTNN